ncbi:hypothetical protein IWQ56_006838 [Coemansia nantahalensis]|nr:hypothetical protein IWQ56_006838 [Coemansia nantahalensis]
MATRQSSVMDRIRWIEKTHGPGQSVVPRSFARPPQLAAADAKPPLAAVDAAQLGVLSPVSDGMRSSRAESSPPAVAVAAAPASVTSPAARQAADEAAHVAALVPAEEAAEAGGCGGGRHSRSASEASQASCETGCSESRRPGDPRRSLGGIRSRAPAAASRRFNKAAPASPSPRTPDSERAEQQPAQAKSRPGLRSSRSLGNVKQQAAADAGQARTEGRSLLTRLTELTANRPHVQDLVNNRGSPKFVKRSHHHSAVPTPEQPSASITWGRYERRFR